MKHSQQLHEQIVDFQTGSKFDMTDSLETMNAYRSQFGGDALRSLYASNGNDWQATVRACKLALDGGARSVSIFTVYPQGE